MAGKNFHRLLHAYTIITTDGKRWEFLSEKKIEKTKGAFIKGILVEESGESVSFTTNISIARHCIQMFYPNTDENKVNRWGATLNAIMGLAERKNSESEKKR